MKRKKAVFLTWAFLFATVREFTPNIPILYPRYISELAQVRVFVVVQCTKLVVTDERVYFLRVPTAFLSPCVFVPLPSRPSAFHRRSCASFPPADRSSLGVRSFLLAARLYRDAPNLSFRSILSIREGRCWGVLDHCFPLLYRYLLCVWLSTRALDFQRMRSLQDNSGLEGLRRNAACYQCIIFLTHE